MSERSGRPRPRLLFVRHGETAFHTGNRYLGRRDAALTDRGLAQAGAVAAWTARQDVRVVRCSPLVRARETAEPAAQAAGVMLRVDPRLVEMDFGSVEGLTAAEIRKRDPGVWTRFAVDPVAHPFPGAEDPRAVADRGRAAVEDAWAALTNAPCGPGPPADGEPRAEGDPPDRTAAGQQIALVVSHSTLMRLTACALLGFDLSAYRRLFPRVDNASGFVLERCSHGWRMLALNPALRL